MYIPSVLPEHEFSGPHWRGEGEMKKERKKERKKVHLAAFFIKLWKMQRWLYEHGTKTEGIKNRSKKLQRQLKK
jgi:hypothetical protein